MTRILAIESSCDETAAAVVADGTRILSNVISSQVDLHAKYGGVVPELASRAPFLAWTPAVYDGARGGPLPADALEFMPPGTGAPGAMSGVGARGELP